MFVREFPFDLLQLDFPNKITAKVLDPTKSPNEWRLYSLEASALKLWPERQVRGLSLLIVIHCRRRSKPKELDFCDKQDHSKVLDPKRAPWLVGYTLLKPPLEAQASRLWPERQLRGLPLCIVIHGSIISWYQQCGHNNASILLDCCNVWHSNEKKWISECGLGEI